MSNIIANTVTTNILPVQALYDPTTLAFITFIGPAGLPFTSAAGGVSSVDVSGGTTGLTTTGGPIVSSGTITIGGTLAVTNGGTGATTSTDAINNLLPSQTGHSGKYLTTDGTNTSWSISGANLSITDDTTTNATRYLTFTSATSGTITSENVASTKLTFNPSSGTLTSTTFSGALSGNASTATSATSATNVAGGSANALVYQSSSGSTTFLAAGSNGQYLTLSGGVPTWTNLSPVTTFSGGTTGLTPNTATSGAITLSGTLNVANGGTGVTTSSGASSVVLRDSNQNITANDFYEGFTSVAASGTTTTLTASSTPNYVVTGSGGQTYKLPDATTLPNGVIFTFNNNQSSGTIVVQNNSSTTVATVQSGAFIEIILLSNSTSAGSWDTHNQAPSNASWSTNTLSWAGSYTNGTWNGNAVGAIYGGTGLTSYTTGDILYASATNTLSKLAAGTNGYVLTLSGGVPTWSATTSATTISDDTTTNSTRYINFTSATSGTLSTIYTSSSKLQYNPSTGTLTTTSLSTSNDASIHGLTVGLGAGSVSSNTAMGVSALTANTSGSNNTVFGYQAGYSNTSGGQITAVGYQAGYTSNSIGGTYLTAVGFKAAYTASTTGTICAIGYNALTANTTGADNTAVGSYNALGSNTTGSSNTAVGREALNSNTTASNNTAVGYQAGYSNTTGAYNVFLGRQAGYVSTGLGNTLIGDQAGNGLTTGKGNTFVGSNNDIAGPVGGTITTGNYNTIIGAFGGNQGGLDIRTSSNYIVLSDGDGNPRGIFDNNGNFLVGTTSTINTGTKSITVQGSGGGVLSLSRTDLDSTSRTMAGFYTNTTQVGGINCTTSATSYATSSDRRLKGNIADLANSGAIIDALQPRTFTWNADNSSDVGFIADEIQAVLPKAVIGTTNAIDAEGKPVYQMLDASTPEMIAYLVAEIKSLRARLKAANIA